MSLIFIALEDQHLQFLLGFYYSLSPPKNISVIKKRISDYHHLITKRLFFLSNIGYFGFFEGKHILIDFFHNIHLGLGLLGNQGRGDDKKTQSCLKISHQPQKDSLHGDKSSFSLLLQLGVSQNRVKLWRHISLK